MEIEVEVSGYVHVMQTHVVFCQGKIHGRAQDVWREYKEESMDSDEALA